MPRAVDAGTSSRTSGQREAVGAPSVARAPVSAPAPHPSSDLVASTDRPRAEDAPTSDGDDEAAVPIDRRSARAERTRTAIVDALLSLLEEGDLIPTAHRIAARAGISLRLIYHHFGDLESLFQAVSARQVDRMKGFAYPIDPSLPVDERVRAIVAKRTRFAEAMTPVLRAARLQEPFSKHVAATREHGHRISRSEVDLVFAGELAGLDPEDRERVALALVGALSWSMWNELRSNGHSVEVTTAVVVTLVRGALPPAR